MSKRTLAAVHQVAVKPGGGMFSRTKTGYWRDVAATAFAAMDGPAPKRVMVERPAVVALMRDEIMRREKKFKGADGAVWHDENKAVADALEKLIAQIEGGSE